MGWTKRQLVEKAYSKIGITAWSFDLDPDMLQDALTDLDAMMAAWDELGIQIGYPLTANPQDADLDTQTDLPFSANEAVFLNLAIRIAPSHGKTVSREMKVAARSGYSALLNNAITVKKQQLPGSMPLGAGNKPWTQDRAFLDRPDTSPLQIGDNGQLVFEE